MNLFKNLQPLTKSYPYLVLGSTSTHNTRKHLVLIVLFLLSFVTSTTLAEQKNENLINSDSDEVTNNHSTLSLSYGMDLVSRYIWRGAEFGITSNNASTPHFQPTLALSYDLGATGAISLGVWGSYGFDGNYSENDIYFNYTVGGKIGSLSLTLNDYYYPFLNIPFSNIEGNGIGAHTLDAQFSYTLPEAFPLSLLISNNIHNDVPENKSLYIETSYPFTISNNSVNVFAGVAKGPSLWHGVTTDKFEFVNVGFKVSKSIKVTEDFSLPTGIVWIYNHHLKKTYLVFKVSI